MKRMETSSLRAYWYAIRRKSPLLRKAVSLLKQIPRQIRPLRPDLPSYAVLANSFPKSGTHLLIQILEALPDIVNYDSFIAQKPTVSFEERSDAAIRRKIRRIVPGELISGHLYHSPDYREWLQDKNVVIYFIYRDLRDVARSEAHYLAHMNRWHRAHGYFRKLTNTSERISVAIAGIPSQTVDFDYPNIAARFSRYCGWLREECVCSVKYEDLMSGRRRDTVRTMVEFFVRQTGVDADVDEITERAVGSIDPGRSRTYREGKRGDWRSVFDPTHRRTMKNIAGDLLVELGYEDGVDW